MPVVVKRAPDAIKLPSSCSVDVPATTSCVLPSASVMLAAGALHSGHVGAWRVLAHCVMHSWLRQGRNGPGGWVRRKAQWLGAGPGAPIGPWHQQSRAVHACRWHGGAGAPHQKAWPQASSVAGASIDAAMHILQLPDASSPTPGSPIADFGGLLRAGNLERESPAQLTECKTKILRFTLVIMSRSTQHRNAIGVLGWARDETK